MAELQNLKYENYIKNEPFELNFRFINPGSVSYKIKTRLDIFRDSNHLFTIWGKETMFNIGDDKNIQVYWRPLNTTGKFKALLRVYYANEILDDGSIEFEIENTKFPEEAIKLTNLKTYEKELILSLKSEKDLENIIITPENYPQGWFVSQEKIDKLKKGEIKKVSIEYEPSLWVAGKKITFQAATLDGKYFGQSSFTMKKEGKIESMIYYSLENIKSIFKIYNNRK